MEFILILLGIAGVIVISIAVEAHLKRNRWRPLAKRARPAIYAPRGKEEKKSLGTEATDLELMARIEIQNGQHSQVHSSLKGFRKFTWRSPKSWATDAVKIVFAKPKG